MSEVRDPDLSRAGSVADADGQSGVADEAAADGVASARERSTTRFPYSDLNEVVKLAQTFKEQFGSECTIDQLAAATQSTASSGAYRTKQSAAAAFGAVVAQRGKGLSLTDLGHRLADLHSRPAAMVDAFMFVPLYKSLYEKHLNRSLPGLAGLNHEIQTLGVVTSQVERARQVFMRSAEQAGMFWSGRDRLVMPGQAKLNTQVSPPEVHPEPAVGAGLEQGESVADSPILTGMWKMLPREAPFPADKRAKWFQALALNIDLLYGEDDVAIVIDRPSRKSTLDPRI